MTSATGVPIGPRPCSPTEAVARALRWVNSSGVYWLGAGDYHPSSAAGAPLDAPWTPTPPGAKDPAGRDIAGAAASDCRFACGYCYRLPAHRPGFNVGSWATVADDLNYNSLIEDAEHHQEIAVPVTDAPQLGDVLCYPTIHLPGHPQPWIGHGSIVVGLDRAGGFDPSSPKFSLLDVVHCHGPAGVAPAITRSDGSVFDVHSERWPKPEHRSRLLRMKP